VLKYDDNRQRLPSADERLDIRIDLGKSEEGRRQKAEGRRFAMQCRLQTYTDCRTPNQRFWSGASTLTPFGRGRGQKSEFPSAFCLLPPASCPLPFLLKI